MDWADLVSKKSIVVLIPAYNEGKDIGLIIDKLNSIDPSIKIFVNDDGSIDNTAKMAEIHGAVVFSNPNQMGQWYSLRKLFAESLKLDPDIIVTMDGDGQHSVDNFKGLVTYYHNNECDLLVGSRLLNGFNIKMPNARKYGILVLNLLLRLMYGIHITDCTCGFKVQNPEKVREVLPHLKQNQYGALEYLIYMNKFNARIKEYSIKNIPFKKSSKGSIKYFYNLMYVLLLNIGDKL